MRLKLKQTIATNLKIKLKIVKAIKFEMANQDRDSRILQLGERLTVVQNAWGRQMEKYRGTTIPLIKCPPPEVIRQIISKER